MRLIEPLTREFEDLDRFPDSLYKGQKKSDLCCFACSIEAFNDDKGCPTV